MSKKNYSKDYKVCSKCGNYFLKGNTQSRTCHSCRNKTSNPFAKSKNLKVNNRKNPAGSLNPQRTYRKKPKITSQRKYKKKPNFKF